MNNGSEHLFGSVGALQEKPLNMPKCILNPCLQLLVGMVTTIKTYEQTLFKSL